MPDDYTVGAQAAEAKLNEEIKQFVPHWAQDKIPADLIHKAASEISKAVIDAVRKSNA